MIKIYTRAGLIAYKTTVGECLAWGGAGVVRKMQRLKTEELNILNQY